MTETFGLRIVIDLSNDKRNDKVTHTVDLQWERLTTIRDLEACLEQALRAAKALPRENGVGLTN